MLMPLIGGVLVPLFKLGASMYILQLTRMLAQQVDPLIIARYIGPGGSCSVSGRITHEAVYHTDRYGGG